MWRLCDHHHGQARRSVAAGNAAWCDRCRDRRRRYRTSCDQAPIRPLIRLGCGYVGHQSHCSADDAARCRAVARGNRHTVRLILIGRIFVFNVSRSSAWHCAWHFIRALLVVLQDELWCLRPRNDSEPEDCPVPGVAYRPALHADLCAWCRPCRAYWCAVRPDDDSGADDGQQFHRAGIRFRRGLGAQTSLPVPRPRLEFWQSSRPGSPLLTVNCLVRSACW